MADLRMSNLLDYQPISTSKLKPLDVCAICPDRLEDCPMLMQCTETRHLTLEVAKQRVKDRARQLGGRRNGKMALAMGINELCDMQCTGTLERIISRAGGDSSV